MKKLLLLFLLIFFIISCGGSSNEGGKITLRFSWWGGDERNSSTLKVIELFENKYPNIDIEAEYGAYDLQKFTSQMAGRTNADIMQVDYPWLPQFANEGQGFYDLYSIENLDLSGFVDGDLAGLTVNEKLMGLPLTLNRRLIILSDYYFNELGIALPETWDEYIAAANRITEAYPENDLYLLYTDNVFVSDIVYPLARQMFDKYLVPEGSREIDLTVDELAQILDFYINLIDNHVFTSQEKFADMDSNPSLLTSSPRWTEGQILGSYSYPSGMGQNIQSEGIHSNEYMKAIPIPQFTKGETKGIFQRIGFQFAISRDAKYPEEAATFLNFYFNDPEAIKAMKLARGVPVNSNALKVLEDNGLLTGIAWEAEKLANELYKNEAMINLLIGDQGFGDQFNTYITEVIYGTMDTRTAAQNIIEQGNLALSRIE